MSQTIEQEHLESIKATQKFDKTKGYKFISYAVWSIRQSIAEEFKNSGIKKV